MTKKREMSPASLENLKKSPHTGRGRKWGDRKDRVVLVSEEGWEGAKVAAKAAGFSGVSELLEEMGRGNVAIAPKTEAPQHLAGGRSDQG